MPQEPSVGRKAHHSLARKHRNKRATQISRKERVFSDRSGWAGGALLSRCSYSRSMAACKLLGMTVDSAACHPDADGDVERRVGEGGERRERGEVRDALRDEVDVDGDDDGGDRVRDGEQCALRAEGAHQRLGGGESECRQDCKREQHRLEDVEVLVDVGEERRVGRGIGRHQEGGPEGEGARERDALPRREGELEAAAHDDLSRVRAHHRRRLARGEQPDGPHVERGRPEARLERVPFGEKAELAAHALSSARPVAVVRGDGRIGRARRQARLRPVGLRGTRGVKETRVVGGDHGEVDVEGEE
mmetsp:Transcript_24842/g.78798  ORF Transcript_24842/g.78798 Transcript_24842/m.78798 type:complete len:304 (+) Transcript_24842:152-1063(+)